MPPTPPPGSPPAARRREDPLLRPHHNATFGNPPFAEASHRILILRLSPWRDVARSSPHLFLAQVVRAALPAAYLDFAFLPTAEERRARLAAKQPLATGIQSGQSLRAFDLVLVSNSFALEAVNLPALLMDSGLAAWASDRPAVAPAIVLGGSNAMAAHALVRADGIAIPDAFFFGEAEPVLAPFLQAWSAAASLPKRDRLLAAAAGLDGFWITGAWPEQPVRQAVSRQPPPAPALLPLLTGDAADTVRLQASAGCPGFCAFCFEGYERKPYREWPADALLAHARQLKAASGARDVEVDAYTLNTHRDAARLILELSRLFDRVSLKSQRLDVLAGQPALVPLEMAAGKRAFTLGVEGVSERMRAFLQKGIDRAAIATAVRQLLAASVREIKLFYLISGHESAADVAEFGACVRELAEGLPPRHPTRMVFSFGYLVRMPHTPLRHDRLFLDREPLDYLTRNLERIVTRSGFEFRLAAGWSEYWASQVLVAADYRIAPVIATLAQEGWIYDGETTGAYADRLRESLPAAGIDLAALVQPKPADYEFPFDFVATPVKNAFLFRQFESAKRQRDAGTCLGDTCRKCGACLDADERRGQTKHPAVPEIPPETAGEVDALTRAKQRLHPVFCRVSLGPAFALTAPSWTGARLMQILLARLPSEIDNLLSAEEALFAAPSNRERFSIPSGDTVVALKAWDAPRLLAALDGIADLGDACVLGKRLTAYAPGQFREASWQVVTPLPPPQAEQALAAWLREAHLPFSLRRQPDGARLELAPAGLRKRSVLSASVTPHEAGSKVTVSFTPKANLLSLLRHLPPAAEDNAVKCLALEC